ncbi:MAG: hypothetical protein ABWZ82_06920 [Candidatus Limnocylindrales bacterium]
MDMRASRLGIAAAVGSLLLASIGAPTFAQDTSAPPSDAPTASGAPSQDPCARFRQDTAASGAPNVAAIALAQEVTTPGEEAAPVDPYQCTLPAWDPSEAWPFGGSVDTAHAFHWSLPRTEGVPADGDIVGVGWAPIRLNGRQARQVRNADVFTTSGPENRTIRNGDYMLIQIETAEVPTGGGDVNRGFHLGTDADGKRSNNVPATVEDPDSVFQDLQNLYTFYQTAGRDAPILASTDFGSGKPGADGTVWYNDNERFAGRVTESPPGVQFLVRKSALGDGFRPFMIGPAPSAARPAGIASIVGTDLPGPVVLDQGSSVPEFPEGSDYATMGTNLGVLPRNGQVNGAAGALRLDVAHGTPPLTYTLRDASGNPLTFPCLSGSPLIWTQWLTFEDWDEILGWFRDQGMDEGDVAEVPIDLLVNKDGQPMTQRTVARVTLRGGNLWVGTVVCLTGYGSYELTGIELDALNPTPIDDILANGGGEIRRRAPRWQVGEEEGRAGGGVSLDSPEAELNEQMFQEFVDAFRPPR